MTENDYILENEVEKLEHSKKCLRGQLVAQGAEIVKLRRELEYRKVSATRDHRRWTETNTRLLDAYRLMWKIAAEESKWKVHAQHFIHRWAEVEGAKKALRGAKRVQGIKIK